MSWDPQIERKQKIHGNICYMVRSFAREFKDPDYFPTVERLYQLAKDTEWRDRYDYNLKTFVRCYLTTKERELFDIFYWNWMIIEVEKRLEEERAEEEE